MHPLLRSLFQRRKGNGEDGQSFVRMGLKCLLKKPTRNRELNKIQSNERNSNFGKSPSNANKQRFFMPRVQKRPMLRDDVAAFGERQLFFINIDYALPRFIFFFLGFLVKLCDFSSFLICASPSSSPESN